MRLVGAGSGTRLTHVDVRVDVLKAPGSSAGREVQRSIAGRSPQPEPARNQPRQLGSDGLVRHDRSEVARRLLRAVAAENTVELGLVVVIECAVQPLL